MPIKISDFKIPKKMTIPELEHMFGNDATYRDILGSIGQGSKIHRIRVKTISAPDGLIIVGAYSNCGSQHWTLFHKSPIHILESDDMALVTCDKCNGIRVPGGKAPPPRTHRPIIDPNTRPKEYVFNYKVDMDPLPGTTLPRTFNEHSSAKAMSPEEAIDKIIKQDLRMGYAKKVYDFDLIAIYAWNHLPLWRKQKP